MKIGLPNLGFFGNRTPKATTGNTIGTTASNPIDGSKIAPLSTDKFEPTTQKPDELPSGKSMTIRTSYDYDPSKPLIVGNDVHLSINAPDLDVIAGNELSIGEHLDCSSHRVRSLVAGDHAVIRDNLRVENGIVAGDNFCVAGPLTLEDGSVNIGNEARISGSLTYTDKERKGTDGIVTVGNQLEARVIKARGLKAGNLADITTVEARVVNIGDLSRIREATARTFSAGSRFWGNKISARTGVFGDRCSIKYLELSHSGTFGEIGNIGTIFVKHAPSKSLHETQPFNLNFMKGLPEAGLNLNLPDGIRQIIIRTPDGDSKVLDKLKITICGKNASLETIHEMVTVEKILRAAKKAI